MEVLGILKKANVFLDDDIVRCFYETLDMDYFLQPIFNCCLINIGDMLENGTVMNGKLIETPKSFRVACTIMTQVIAAVASSQYGGQSVAIEHLGRFLKISHDRFRKECLEEMQIDGSLELLGDKVNDVVEKRAAIRLKEELKAGVQTIQYQINTLMTTNGQSPFVTLFMRIDEKDKYADYTAMIIEEILKQRLQGIKNEAGVYVTPAFPKLIYVLDEHNCLKGGKYDYLTKLAVKCSAKRMYPDYISAKKMRENYNGEVFSCMGCVEGSSVIDYRRNGVRYVESFERAWNRLINEFGYMPKTQINGTDKYIDLKQQDCFDIWDNKLQDYTPVYRFIRNTQNEWFDITFSGGRHIVVTDNHPFETENRGIVLAKDLQLNDEILRDIAKDIPKVTNEVDEKYWLAGIILCDGCYDRQFSISLGLDENDIVSRVKEILINNGYEPYIKEWHRGKKGNYQEIRIRDFSGISKYCAKHFEGVPKRNRHIPAKVFRATTEQKYSFLAGMIDADGYINSFHNSIRVQIGSTNKELAIQQMLLAKDLGLNAIMCKNAYNSNNKNRVRYRVEFNMNEQLYYYLASEKKKNHFDFNHKTYANVLLNSNKCRVMKITAFSKEQFSYDVTTKSEHFTVNGIYSHNCRSFLSPWKDENGNYKWEGRFNMGVVSINLPQIALIAQGNETKFWTLLDERLELCKEALMCRYKSLLGTPSDVSPIHWQYGAIARLKKGENIDKLLKNGYATISLGYIGVYETTKLMTGESHTSGKGEKFALKVMHYMKDKCDAWKKETGLGFGLYGSPAESLCYRFAEIDKKKFGVIKDVTDKGYYTNSYHVDVREKIDAFSKLKFESQFQDISSGGAISYVEIPNLKNNLEALEEVVKFIYDNIQYAEFNTKSDYCHVCGYDGEIIVNKNLQWECPQCHNTDKNKLTVTRRTCGYLGENFWNVGKTKEIASRVTHL